MNASANPSYTADDSNSKQVRWLKPTETGTTTSLSLAEAVRDGLTGPRKELPSRFFYDAKGSALFESICDLPEYYLTRAETEILESSADDLAAQLPDVRTLVELGSGSATKTELLIRSFEENRELCYAPVDVSRSALEQSVSRLEERHPDLQILATVAEYEVGLDTLQSETKSPRLLLWLGSSIGNLRKSAAAKFLRRLADSFQADDSMLIGIDLRKDRTTLESAYDDSAGLTAEFNLNLLARINRELEATFDLDRFRHVARYDEKSGSVESYLESKQAHRVEIGRLDLEIEFSQNERIHTEDSFKYSVDEIDELAAGADLEVTQRYFDSTQRFSLNLLRPQ